LIIIAIVFFVFLIAGMNQQMQEDAPSNNIPPTPKPTLEETDTKPTEIESTSITQECSGVASCISGKVSRIIDGDTIDVDGQRIRFALSSAPELNEFGGIQARDFIEELCPVGSSAIVDEDDLQLEGSYGRIVAVIYCNGLNLNEELLDAGLGEISFNFCHTSEFSNDSWAQKHGCPILEPSEIIPEQSCDPSYPDVCIPVYPPDLDCGEISYSNFKVISPDKHGFDGDGDGIGCEN